MGLSRKDDTMADKKKRYLNFRKWCAKDTGDTRKINYVIHMNGNTIRCTSEDFVEPRILEFARNEAVIYQKELKGNEWYIELKSKKEV